MFWNGKDKKGKGEMVTIESDFRTNMAASIGAVLTVMIKHKLTTTEEFEQLFYAYILKIKEEEAKGGNSESH